MPSWLAGGTAAHGPAGTKSPAFFPVTTSATTLPSVVASQLPCRHRTPDPDPPVPPARVGGLAGAEGSAGEPSVESGAVAAARGQGERAHQAGRGRGRDARSRRPDIVRVREKVAEVTGSSQAVAVRHTAESATWPKRPQQVTRESDPRTAIRTCQPRPPGRLAHSGQIPGVRLLPQRHPGQPECAEWPRGRPSTWSRLRTRVALASRGCLRSSACAARRSASVDDGRRMISFSSARRAAYRSTISWRCSFFAILLFFAIRPSPLVRGYGDGRLDADDIDRLDPLGAQGSRTYRPSLGSQ